MVAHETAGIEVFCSMRPSTNHLWYSRIILHTIKRTVGVGGVSMSLICNALNFCLPPRGDLVYYRDA